VPTQSATVGNNENTSNVSETPEITGAAIEVTAAKKPVWALLILGILILGILMTIVIGKLKKNRTAPTEGSRFREE
jgi:cobalamin biosynthesis Mg chelatase CobN